METLLLLKLFILYWWLRVSDSAAGCVRRFGGGVGGCIADKSSSCILQIEDK